MGLPVFTAKSARRVFQMVGEDAILLPVKQGTKRCFLPGWNHVRYEDTMNPQYSQMLAISNIAVKLGRPTGVCVIDVDDDAMIEKFIAAMPCLAKTLRTRGARGCAFWLRLTGDYPSTGGLALEGKAVGEWRADRGYSVIYGLHPDTKLPYETLVDAPMESVTWDDIKFPAGVAFVESRAYAGAGAAGEDTPELATLRAKVDEVRAAAKEEPMDWVEFNRGFAPCPGIEKHSTADNPTDFMVMLGGELGVGVKCLHQGNCKPVVGYYAVKLRKAVCGGPSEDEAEEAILTTMNPVPAPVGVEGTEGSCAAIGAAPVGDEDPEDALERQLAEKKAEKAARRMEERMKLLDDIHFDGHVFWYKIKKNWVSCSADNIMLKLNSMGFHSNKVKGADMTPAARAKLHIIENNRVTGALPLCHQKDPVFQNGGKFLNTSTTRCIAPCDEMALKKWADGFPWLAAFLDHFFAEPIQLQVFLAWLRRYYGGSYELNPKIGQALIIVGGVERGKTLLATRIIRTMVGEFADAADYLLGTYGKFTSSLFKSPLWVVDDSTGSADFRKKATYTAMIKKTAANTTFLYEEKYLAAITTEWKGRLVVLMNEDPISLENLPNIDSSNLDKLILLRCAEREVVFPEWDELDAILDRELPHFARWLLQWSPPKEVLSAKRYGVVSYHDTAIRENAANCSDTAFFAEALDEAITAWFGDTTNKDVPGWKEGYWEGKVTDLVRLANGTNGDGEHAHLFRDTKPNQFGFKMKKAIATGTASFKVEFKGSNQRKPWKITRR